MLKELVCAVTVVENKTNKCVIFEKLTMLLTRQTPSIDLESFE